MYPIYKNIGTKENCEVVKVNFPPQHQDCHPGLEYIMNPRPISENVNYKGSNKLEDKVAIITGGDSGIGRAVAYAFAKEGANIVIAYLNEDEDASETCEHVETLGRKCIAIKGDLQKEENCKLVIDKTLEEFGKIDILVNNHAVQYIQQSILDIDEEQLEKTFRTNIFSFFYLVKAALPHLKANSSIINTTSVTAFKGEELLIDYSATKGAILAFTRSLSQSLVEDKIRVNAVAPGPIWTPLITSSFNSEEVETFGSLRSKVPMDRAGQPYEVANAYVFLASDDSSYMTGQVLHVNGGNIVG
ncbi:MULTISPECIES: SDR family oxidoreductase [Terrisporobacter]|uniref:Dehydrogenase n=2 Tax=Terrisporobacter TaxID=1505652 RepID=A0A0B3W5M4_9FIRM|nr:MULTISPECIES: SDR family oxidoreductase [Terrisporobacter]KHS57692.1 dehydrogenase [Terrisporobacter othiniensis]MCR1824582.1 SDR family oxidoreductase [Terrisporobacter muris]MDY3372527.1 SDR family oxidoreductase [Terrisporobacter othiniensis]